MTKAKAASGTETMRGVATEHLVDLDRATQRFVRRRSLRLLGQVLRPMRRQVVWLIVLLVTAQLAKAAGPLLVAGAINHALPALTKGHEGPLIGYGAVYLTTALAAGVLGWMAITRTATVSQAALLRLRRRTFRQVQRLSLDFHESYTSGRVIARQTSDVDAIRELLDAGINQLLGAVLFMGSVAVLLTLLDPVSGALLLLAALPAWLLTRWFQRRSQVHYRETRVASSNLIVQFVETITGLRAVQAFRRERDAVDEHARLAEEYRRTDVKAMGLNGVYDPALIFLGYATVAIILAIDGYRFLHGHLLLGTLMAAVLYALRFFSPLEQMTRFHTSLQAAVASLEKISGLLDENPGIEEARSPARIGSVAGEIHLDRVSFGYTAARPIVADLDVLIPAGQTVALIGATGAGKSTIAKLIARFYDVSSGTVSIDGVDVRQWAFADLRRHVVVVTQEPFLFSGSIADNIAMGRPGASAAEVRAAAAAVGADAFIARLPEGYETDVNKRGGRLSAGERQLVSFARAFLADPSILILDEATSSLDVQSEARVQRALASLLEGRTAVIIAHRLSTLDIADRVLVLRDGAVIEDGSPQQLTAAGGEFAALRATWDRAVSTSRPASEAR